MNKIAVTKSQILHLLSAIVFVPMASVTAAWLSKHFPGLPHFSPKQIADEEYVVASLAGGLAIHYLHGLQIWERTGGKVIDVQDKLAPGTTAKEQAEKEKAAQAAVASSIQGV